MVETNGSGELEIPVNLIVFIVEDNNAYSLLLKKYLKIHLKKWSTKIFSYTTGESCLQKFKKIKPDILILDYELNSHTSTAENGLKILDRVKLMKVECKIIMLTSNIELDTALASFQHGAANYILKNQNSFSEIIRSITEIVEEKIKSNNSKRLEREFQSREWNRRLQELSYANNELVFQKIEKEKRMNELNVLTGENEVLEKEKTIVLERNKDITDSIRYAKRIQTAKLPKVEDIQFAFEQSFVLFLPKDIVSGDFYFFHRTGETIILAVADCTGHGVPGAFMSMLCSVMLDEAVMLTSDLSEILGYINRHLKVSLQQTVQLDSTRDGMDIALCKIDKQSGVVHFAGANRPIWILRKDAGYVEELKGTKKAIGGLTEDAQIFAQQEISFNKGDTFYLTTDGFSDQFGGPDGKKMMSKNFKEQLLGIQSMTMPEQKIYLKNFAKEWKGNIEQVDDILVMGIRF